MLVAAGSTTLNNSDLDFVNSAAKGGTAEVEMGHLAVQKSANPEVKRFANRMVRDHSRVAVKLTALASMKGVSLPDGKGIMNDATYLELKVLSGKEFDKAYVKAMLADHQEDVAAFQKESAGAQDPDVKTFAAQTLPTLQEHLNMIQKLKPTIDAQ
jgi:putative membrane protein